MERCQRLESQQLNHQALLIVNPLKNKRRKHPRYKMNENVLSISEDILAEVLNISRSGISCQCLASVDEAITRIEEIELFNYQLGTSVNGLLCNWVRSSIKTISPTSPLTMVMDFSLNFQDLTQIKQRQLFQFIKDGGGYLTLTQNFYEHPA